MNLSDNAPRTLGTVLGVVPTAIAAVVVAFVGTDWSGPQVASVLGLAAVIGGVIGYLAGDRVQRDYTTPQERGAITLQDVALVLLIIVLVLILIALL